MLLTSYFFIICLVNNDLPCTSLFLVYEILYNKVLAVNSVDGFVGTVTLDRPQMQKRNFIPANGRPWAVVPTEIE